MNIFQQSTAVCLMAGITSVLTGCGDPRLEMGEKVFNTTCVNCHMQAMNGAPILGNKKMWGKRLPQGVPALIQHAINGYSLMPAKGGNPDLNDDQVAAAVEYMVRQVQ
jgi:cytochrome c5